MTSFTFDLPTRTEEEFNRRFQVHKNYLGAIDLFLAENHGSDPVDRLKSLVDQQRHLRGYRKIQRSLPTRAEEVRRLLTLSWASEAQLRVHNGAEDAVLPYANAWAPVHSYYAVYMACLAWLAAQGHPDTPNHRAVLTAIAREVNERKLLPLPWSVSATGCPDIRETEWRGLPGGTDPGVPLELLENPAVETFWPRYCKMLETTRKRRLKALYAEWYRQNDRRITRTSEKRAIAAALAPTTLLDFFWRLRVRSNYQNVDLFLMSTVGDDWHRDFYNSVSSVTEATCMMFENLIIQRVGPQLYRGAIDGFRRRGGPLAEDVVGRKAGLLLED